MALTPAQYPVLAAAINASLDAQVVTFRTEGNYGGLATYYNDLATPAYIVWRTNVQSDEIGGAWVGTDIDGMSALNMQRLQLLLQSSSRGLFDMRRADRRAGFENPFGTNVNNASRVAMRAVWKRSATRAEALLATGTGTDATPSTLQFEGALTGDEVRVALTGA